jgi:predicted acyl esterase
MQAVTIESKDGTRIAARVFEPDSDARRPGLGNVVIGGAMGVRPRLAQWLAGLDRPRVA